MAEKKLKTGILGLTETGRQMLEAAWQSQYFDICAVSDSDTPLVDSIARQYECKPFND